MNFAKFTTIAKIDQYWDIGNVSTNWTFQIAGICYQYRYTLLELKLSITSTPDGGSVLGIVKPIWQKAAESELRIKWLGDMLDRDLVIRDVMRFGQIIEDKFRTESSKEEEIGRQVLTELMRVKLIDEKRYYREVKRTREVIRDFLRKRLGRKKYDKLIEDIKPALEKIKEDLSEKYKQKTKHLAALREIEKQDKIENVPAGLEKY